MIKAMESGTGSISTTHASDAVAAVRKLVTCAMEAGPHVTQALATSKLAATVDLIVHLDLRHDDARQRLATAPPGRRDHRPRAGRAGDRLRHHPRLRARPQTATAVPAVLPDDYRALAAHGFDLPGYLRAAGGTTMIVLVPALAGALIVAGVIGIVVGLHPTPAAASAAGRARRVRADPEPSRGAPGLAARWPASVPGWSLGSVTGWVARPVARPGRCRRAARAPVARRPQPHASSGSRRWRNGPARLSGVLTVGVGLEQALVATLRSTPAPIAPEVTRLVARLRARWATEDALRAFADELDDATGDLVAANLILGARRRGAGLASVLEGLAESVAADVRARRQVEADRAKPRATARWVTLIRPSVLVILAVRGPTSSRTAARSARSSSWSCSSAYVATLVWMRQMAIGRPSPASSTRERGAR